MARKIGACVLALLLLGSACSKKTDTGAGDKGKTYTVQIDTKRQGAAVNTFALAYYPSEVKIHAGDTVRFKLNWSGEPHSVTFGTLIDTGFGKIPPSPPDDFEEPAELAKIPPMIPEGPGPAPPVSVDPCFAAAGDPSPTTCKKDQPVFDGKYSMYSSGFIAEGANFTVKTDAALAAATYNYFCTLHRGAMAGKVTVVPATEAIDDPAKVEADANSAIDAYVTKAAGLADKIKNGMGPGTVFAGGFDPEAFVAVTQFGPKDVKAKVGEVVKFIPAGFHTVSFNPSQGVVGTPFNRGASGWEINRPWIDPAGGPKPVAPTKPTGNVSDGGTWNGEGFFSSGALPGEGPPGFLTFQMRFGKAGTYKYVCLFHPDMEGSVTVS